MDMKSSVWEYRVEIKNHSCKTIRNISVTAEHMGQMPIRPSDKLFDKIKRMTCDINPGCSELVSILRWPIPEKSAGMLSGTSALEYGPIKVIASAENTRPSTRIFKLDYQREPMLFD